MSKPKFYSNLNNIYSYSIDLLKEGANDRKSDFHICYISTVTQSTKPSSRCVVLRGFDEKNRILTIHSDYRARKIKELKKNNNTTILFYSPSKKIQIKLEGSAIIHNKNQITKKAWDNMANYSKRCYLTEKAPGNKLIKAESGFPHSFKERMPNNSESYPFYKNFSVIRVKLHSLEWLFLHGHGNRRALFNFKKKKLESEWLVP